MGEIIMNIDQQSQFMINARKKGLAQVTIRCARVARLAEDNADRAVASLNNSRADWRRREGRALDGSFKAVVDPSEGFRPVVVRMFSLANRPKLGISLGELMNIGAKGHEINGNKGLMYFPRPESNVYDPKTIVKAKKVQWEPGPKTAMMVGFMQDALDDAMNTEFQGAIERTAARKRGHAISHGLSPAG